MKRRMTVALLSFVLIAIGSTGWTQMIDRTDSRVQTTLKTGWKCLGTIQPRSVGEIDAGQNWTLGCETLCRDYIYWDTYKDYVAPLGIKTIRLQGGWAKTEKVQAEVERLRIEVQALVQRIQAAEQDRQIQQAMVTGQIPPPAESPGGFA